MAILTFQDARKTVLEKILHGRTLPAHELVPCLQSVGRVLAQNVLADRDFPPFHRSTRDGYSVRSADIGNAPAKLLCAGLARAGTSFNESAVSTQCVEIMTGAAIPQGADAVVMVEHTQRQGDWVEIRKPVTTGENIVWQGSEARQGDDLIPQGRRIGYAEIAVIAAVGISDVPVYQKPRVAILPTGDEIVDVAATPGSFQIRNSNSYSLQAQVATSGATAIPLPIAPDEETRLRQLIEEGLACDVLLLSGGVSAGRFDLVEKVLSGLGAEFYFDGVSMQPGKPLVFGSINKTFFFGLPGNPLSTMVTFELFVDPALRILVGENYQPQPLLKARLAKTIRRKPGLSSFLPAILEGDPYDPVISPLEWKGSGDLAGLNRANCYMAIPDHAEELQAGQWVSVLSR